MSWWGWLIFYPIVFIVVILAILAFALLWDSLMTERLHRWRYNWRAKRHNNKALKLRLAKDTWQGLPLPTGKQGSLTISRETLVQFPYSVRQIEKIMLDRAIDLGVGISIEWMPIAQRFEITWGKPKKNKLP